MTTLFIKSNGLRGQRLFDLVTVKLGQMTETNEWGEIVTSRDVELVIDGEDWNWEHNVKGQLTAINKVW